MSWRPAGRDLPAEKETKGYDDEGTNSRATIASLLAFHEQQGLRWLLEHKTLRAHFAATIYQWRPHQDTQPTADNSGTSDTEPEPQQAPSALIMLDTDQWGHSEIELQIVTTWEDSDEWDSGSDQDTADAPKAADTAPEPPRTPEQPTVAVSRATPTKDAARELLDTRIVPRALWGVEGEGLQQEQAL